MSSERINQKTRTLIVHKDDTGYGLTLSGDKPTRVQTVRTGGASHRAGVREGDVIIKVNGQHVMNSDHNEVVTLIQSGSYVALTVVHTSKLPCERDTSWSSTMASTTTSTSPQDQERREAMRSPTGITGPQPVSDQVLRMTQAKSVETLELMIEEQTREIDELRSQLARSPSKKLREKLEDAERKLVQLKTKATRHSSPPDASLPPLPPTPSGGAPSGSSPGTPVTRRVAEDVQDSTPVAPPRSESLSCSLAGEGGPPPPLPARNTAPTPPPRNIPPSSSVLQPTPGLPPPPPKIPRHNSHENISNVGEQRRVGGMPPLKPHSSPHPPPKYAVHTRTRSSPSSLDQTLEIAKTLNFDGGGRSPRYETPPGTPPPPYNPSLHGGSSDSGRPANMDILTMEDDSEDEGGGGGGEVVPGLLPNLMASPEAGFGVFNRLNDLIKQTAHLAVFLNYVCSNSDPAPLLFYLITDIYKQGTLKEMRKWAYEIHSCFLLRQSPLEISKLDPGAIQSIESLLAEETDREETMQKLFWKARARSREMLKFQLDEFREKLALGMGSIYGGPSTSNLKEAEGNESKRLQIVEDILLPLLDTMVSNFECADDRGATLCSALATVLVKSFSIRSTSALASIDKIPLFVSKEKKREKIFQRVLKKLTVKGHNFYLRHYDQLSYCHHSREVIWGIGPQGYRCSNCDFDVYKKFINQVEEMCAGPSQDKKKRNRTSMGFLGLPKGIAEVGRIMSKDQLQVLDSRKTSSVSPSPSIRGTSDLASFRSYTSDNILTSPDLHLDHSEADSSTPSSGRKMNEPTPSSVRRWNNSGGNSTPPSGGSGINYAFGSSDISPRDSWINRPEKSSSIKRSESAKDGAKRQQPRPYHRKHSDPSLSVGGKHHVNQSADDSRVSKSGSSSSSSLLPLEASSRLGQFATNQDNRLQRSDSDNELLGGEVECPDWRKLITSDKLNGIHKREQKRQDVINELFHTERNHVRNLKILDSVFRKPLQESGLMNMDMIDRLFPNLEDVLTVHQTYSMAMRQKTLRGFPVGPIGDLLEDMFQGSAGERLIEAGATFTQEQHFTIDELKKLRSRDPKLEAFLCDQEKRPECRRLQLQSLLPVEHQRLVKYPLLLENLIKHCDPNEPKELEQMKSATQRAREIVEKIDKKVAASQNQHKLVEVQRNLDTSGLEKMGADDPVCREYRNVDLTTHTLLYDGTLTLNLSGENRRNKKIELHVLLLDDSIMFLQKQDEKYLLKFHSLSSVTPLTSGRDEATRRIHSPVIKFSSLLVRTVATNKRAFFVINNPSTAESQLNELIASSRDECERWLRHINQAAEIYKSKTSLMSAHSMSASKLPRTSTSLSLQPQTSSPHLPAAFTGQLSADAGSAAAGLGGGHHDVPNRSQSFNESAMRRDSIQFRPLPTPPPLDAPQAESLEDKLARLDEKDQEISRALEEKHRLRTEILNIPPEEYDTIVDLTASKQRLDTKDALMSLMADTDNLDRWLMDALGVDQHHEGAPPPPQTAAMNNSTLEKILPIADSLRHNTRLILGMLSLELETDEDPSTESAGGYRSSDRSHVRRSRDVESMGSRPHSFISNDSIEIRSDDGVGGLQPADSSYTSAMTASSSGADLSLPAIVSGSSGHPPSSGQLSLQLPFGRLDSLQGNNNGEDTPDEASSTKEWSPRPGSLNNKDITPTNDLVNNNLEVEELLGEEDSLEMVEEEEGEVEENLSNNNVVGNNNTSSTSVVEMDNSEAPEIDSITVVGDVEDVDEDSLVTNLQEHSTMASEC